MRCKSCDYPLWSIRSRTCPECGTGFVPSEYEFAANAVEFRCPHCEQVYYGTGERGGLVPRRFDCVSCGASIEMDEMVLFPAEGVEERRATVPLLPWLDKRRRWTAGWRTVGMAMVQPRLMMDQTPVESSVGRAWLFYTLVMLVVVVVSGAVVVVLAAGFGGLMPGLMVLGGMLLLIYGYPVVWGLSAHVLMKLLRAQPKHTLGRTYQAICYSSGTMLPTAVPCIGAYFLWMFTGVWWVVSATLAVPRAQGARAGRGAVAVVVLPVLLVVGVVGFYTFAMVSVFRTVGTMTTATAMATAAAHRSAAQVHGALVSHVSMYGAPPHHAVELLANGSMARLDLVGQGAIIRPPTEASVLGGWETMTPVQQWEMADLMAESLEEDWVAHRLGDVVFTYNGVDLASPQDGGLWVFVYWLDPASGATVVVSGELTLMRADGVAVRFKAVDFENLLADQNELRRAHGLGELPHPEEVVTVGVPADVIDGGGE